MVGHFLERAIGDIADIDAQFGGGGDVDGVETYAIARNDPALVERADHPWGQLRILVDNGICSGAGIDQLVLGLCLRGSEFKAGPRQHVPFGPEIGKFIISQNDFIGHGA